MPNGPMTSEPPDHLLATLESAWGRIVVAVSDRHSPFATPTVATVRRDGGPALRSVVLRACEPSARTIRFHTDRRSDKVEEIARDPRVSVHFYDPALKLQIRIEGEATVHQDDAHADVAWRESQPMSRVCYRIEPGPGTPIARSRDYTTRPDLDEETIGRSNFVAVIVTAVSLDFLELAAEGHRRARFRWIGEVPIAEWVVP